MQRGPTHDAALQRAHPGPCSTASGSSSTAQQQRNTGRDTAAGSGLPADRAQSVTMGLDFSKILATTPPEKPKTVLVRGCAARSCAQLRAGFSPAHWPQAVAAALPPLLQCLLQPRRRRRRAPADACCCSHEPASLRVPRAPPPSTAPQPPSRTRHDAARTCHRAEQRSQPTHPHAPTHPRAHAGAAHV